MSLPRSSADAEVMFRLLPTAQGGRGTPAGVSYCPHYAVKDDYLTSVQHDFLDREWVHPGEEVLAHVWFLTPEHYPHSLWVGRVIAVCEGSRVVGEATVKTIFNPVLEKTEFVEVTVDSTFTISQRGVGVMIGDPRPWWPWFPHRVQVTKPDGAAFEARAEVEFARKDGGEVMTLLFPTTPKQELPVGSRIRSLEVLVRPVKSATRSERPWWRFWK